MRPKFHNFLDHFFNKYILKNFLNEILIKNVKTITDVARKRYETTNIRRTTLNASLWEFLFDSNLRQTVLDLKNTFWGTKSCSNILEQTVAIWKRIKPADSYCMIHTFLVKTWIVMIRCRILENEHWIQSYKSFQTVQLQVLTVIFSWLTTKFTKFIFTTGNLKNRHFSFKLIGFLKNSLA